MDERIKGHQDLVSETQEVQVTENNISEDTSPEVENVVATTATNKPKFTKKKFAIIGGIVAVIAIALIIFVPSKFERVQNECVQIAGMISGSGDYFTIDTYPDDMYGNMDETLKAILLADADEKALKAIKYANEELGFNGSVYSNMMNTSALMGRQSAETNKYRVSWTYHPDDGLEVTYEKK